MSLPTDAEIAQYRSDGAICLRGAFSLDWIGRLRAAVDADMAAPGPPIFRKKMRSEPSSSPIISRLERDHQSKAGGVVPR